jgi:hypothetical protein
MEDLMTSRNDLRLRIGICKIGHDLFLCILPGALFTVITVRNKRYKNLVDDPWLTLFNDAMPTEQIS